VKKNRGFFAMHLSESIDEVEAFTENSGPLFDMLNSNDRWFFGKGERASAWYAVTNSLIPRKSLVINPGYIGGDELGALASNMCTIAISPRINQLFNLQVFPLEAAINRGINLAVVTETPALSHTISLLDELFELRLVNPTIPALDLIDLITRNPAKMLKQKGTLGVISEGALADIIGIKMDRRIVEPLEEVISGESKIHFVVVGGEEILIP
jgi:cytosine/adenosine deaminase-related metal-dependent hydrolase